MAGMIVIQMILIIIFYLQISNHIQLCEADANDLYNVASTAVIGIYVNHFLSALDAAWSVATYNREIAMKMRVEQMNLAGRIELVPTINFSLSF